MNIPNNKRKRESQEKIEKVFVQLLQTKEINNITVSDICKLAKVNRSTFYANYIDIKDLVEKLHSRMINDFFNIYAEEVSLGKHSYDFLKLFKHIKNNQLFYKTYFKLGIDYMWDSSYNIKDEMIKWYGNSNYSEYHIIFFRAGINAVIQKWLNNGWKESPEEIEKIIKDEYTKRNRI